MDESREDFAARLRRTLRAAGVAPAAESPSKPQEPDSVPAPQRAASEPLPQWYLRRPQRATLRKPAETATPILPAHAAHSVARTRGMPRDISTQVNERGSFGVRVERFPADFVHGELRLDEVLGARGAPLAQLTGDTALESFDPCDCTFLDIETTGLSGGAGTQVFQIGLLHFDGDEFELWQGFLRSPAEAPALLQACSERVRRRGALVSFFGKSFDRHRLEDQMRLHGVPPPFEARAHLDLYHPCRRLYRAAFVDGRLATMERELCGVQRERDLPGSFAPAAWFDFLAGREHLLEAVFLHNRLDVLSLVTLCAHLSRALEPESLPARHGAARARALTELFARRRDWPGARDWSGRVLELDPTDRAALLVHATALERCGESTRARDAFEQLTLADDALAAQACAALARLELRAGHDEAALRACARARRLADATLTGTGHARLSASVQRMGVRASSCSSAARKSDGVAPTRSARSCIQAPGTIARPSARARAQSSASPSGPIRSASTKPIA